MIKTLLWDFGDTLVDETWLQLPMPECERWPQAYRDLVYHGPLIDEWNLGNVDTNTVAEALADHLSLPVGKVLAHMELACKTIRFFEYVVAYAKSSSLPQAIVTVNPDIFSTVVATHYNLFADFPVIVTSWEERTLSKSEICDIALDRQGLNIERAEALLIDNKSENIDAWVAVGGAGYLFRGEQAFRQSPPIL